MGQKFAGSAAILAGQSDRAIAIDRLQDLLQSAVRRQIQDLPANEPVGVLLSGGLDSSIVAALLVQNGIKVRAYSLDFGEAGSSEYPYAEQVAHYLQIPIIKVPVLVASTAVEIRSRSSFQEFILKLVHYPR
jgi:asparagine synthase (glutamine-hydrolysing)